MMPDPPTLAAETTVGEALRRLSGTRLAALPVVDGTGAYLGLFGADDAIGLLLPAGAGEGLVPDLGFMADDPGELRERLAAKADLAIGPLLQPGRPVLGPDSPIVEALFLLHKHRHPLAVVDPGSGRLLGLVSEWEALAALRGPGA